MNHYGYYFLVSILTWQIIFVRQEHKDHSPDCPYINKVKNPYTITVGEMLELEKSACKLFIVSPTNSNTCLILILVALCMYVCMWICLVRRRRWQSFVLMLRNIMKKFYEFCTMHWTSYLKTSAYFRLK